MSKNDVDPFGVVRCGVVSICLFFALLIVATLARGGTIVDVVAMPRSVLLVANASFSAACLAFLVMVAWFNIRGISGHFDSLSESDVVAVKSEHGDSRAFFVKWENHMTPIYQSEGIDYDVACLMSGGSSRSQIVGMGLSGTQFNKFSSWLREKGVVGEYDVVRA